MPQSSRGREVRTEAWLLKRSMAGEGDLVIALFTEQLGLVRAVAAHARQSRRRFGGSLEPFHTLVVRLRERAHSELWRAEEASVTRPRPALVDSLPRLDAAGRFLGWVRKTATTAPEPAVWQLGERFLDGLSGAADAAESRRLLASAGLQLLVALGWRLELQRCVRTGDPCPPNKAARVDPELGGVVSSRAGSAPLLLRAGERQRLSAAQDGGDTLEPDDAAVALKLVEATLRAHAGVAT